MLRCRFCQSTAAALSVDRRIILPQSRTSKRNRRGAKGCRILPDRALLDFNSEYSGKNLPPQCTFAPAAGNKQCVRHMNVAGKAFPYLGKIQCDAFQHRAQKILSAASEPNPQKCTPKLRTAAMCSASCKARVEQDPVCADWRLCGKRVQALISIRLRRKISA